jgi:predicted ATP-dependent serine protease
MSVKGTRECRKCGERYPENRASCPACGRFFFSEESSTDDETVLLSEMMAKGIKGVKRIVTGLTVDANFGGGIPYTSVTLLGGLAGAGKSTLSLQLADIIAGETKEEILYVCAEEGEDAIVERAVRLDLNWHDKLRFVPLGKKPDLNRVISQRRPKAVFLDSLPGFVSSPDEAVELAKAFKLIVVEANAIGIIIDHVTKEDEFAGLERLKHDVDITMTIYPTEGEVREITTHKNRFGRGNFSTQMLMTEGGLLNLDATEGEDETE